MSAQLHRAIAQAAARGPVTYADIAHLGTVRATRDAVRDMCAAGDLRQVKSVRCRVYYALPSWRITRDWLLDRVQEEMQPTPGGHLIYPGHWDKRWNRVAVRVGDLFIDVRRELWRRAKRQRLKTSDTLVAICAEERCMNIKHLALEGTHSHPHSLQTRQRIAAALRARSSLSQSAAEQIRVSNEPVTVLAKRYGISPSMAHAIRSGRWRRDYSNPYTQLMR